MSIVRDENYPPHIRALLIQAVRGSSLDGFNSSLSSFLKNTNVAVRASATLALFKNGSMDTPLLRSNLLAEAPYLGVASPVIYEDLHFLNEHELAYDFASQSLRKTCLGRSKYRVQFDSPWSETLMDWPLRARDKTELLSNFRKELHSPEDTLCFAKLLLPHSETQQMLREGLEKGGWLEQWENSEHRRKLRQTAEEDWGNTVGTLYSLIFSLENTFRWTMNPSAFDLDTLRTAGSSVVELLGDLVFYRDFKRSLQIFHPIERSDFYRNYIQFALVPFDDSARQFTIDALKSPWPGVAFEAAKVLGMSNELARAVMVEALWGHGIFSGTTCPLEARTVLGMNSPEMQEYRCIIAAMAHAQTQSGRTTGRGRDRVQTIEDESQPSAIEQYFHHRGSPSEGATEMQRAVLLEFLSLPLFNSFDIYGAYWLVANDYAKDYIPPAQ